MIAAVDTSILLDVLIPDPIFADASEALLAESGDEGLIICPEVYAEVVPHFTHPFELDLLLIGLGVEVIPTEREVGALAGLGWRAYRQRRGPRERIVTDFIVGAHAQIHTGLLLSRDRGFFRDYFRGLTVLRPPDISPPPAAASP